MPTIIEVMGCAPVAAYTFPSIDKVPVELRNTYTGRIGIEVEVERHQYLPQNPLTPLVWRHEADGSLRNSGIEFISHPMAASLAPDALYLLLEDSLVKDSCFSPRTSVHVHMDFQQVPEGKVKDFILIYCALEKLLYRFVGRGRYNSIYCVPITHTTALAFSLKRDITSITRRWSKYTGMNLAPLRPQGTIEMRHLHGTKDYSKICIWIRLLMALREWAINTPTSSIRRTLNMLSRSSDVPALLTEIFGQDASWLRYKSFEDIETELEIIRIAQLDVTTANKIQEHVTRDSDFFKAIA